MSELGVLWRRYGLRDNPYSHAPLTIEGGTIPLSCFTGRLNETRQLKNALAMGSGIRYMVVGHPGVGKTTLVNYVRSLASCELFFTPSREIELNRLVEGNDLIVTTICALYDEVIQRGLTLSDEIDKNLKSLRELAEHSALDPAHGHLDRLQRHKLLDLFAKLCAEIVHPRFKGIIIHYDNLDNIEEAEGLAALLSDIRDFLLTDNAIFIFVGDQFLPAIIGVKPRVAQIFVNPPLEVPSLSYGDVQKILDERLQALAINSTVPIVPPHTDEALRTLFKLHDGNLRDILNSLTSCMISMPATNRPVQISDSIMRDVLFEKVQNQYFTKLSQVETEVLVAVLAAGPITPTDLAKRTGKSVQNISSKYIRKLFSLGAVKLAGSEGRNKFYEVSSEIKWRKLRRSEQEKASSRKQSEEMISTILQRSLKEFI